MLEYFYSSDPSPHIYFPQLLPPEIYKKVKFPTLEARPNGRIGLDLFEGDQGYNEAVASDGFKEIYNLFSSAQFVKWILSIFEQDLIRYGCRIRNQEAELISYLETRERFSTVKTSLDENSSDNLLFTRFDFQAANDNYERPVHVDFPRRVTGGVLFFSDAEQEKIEGGQFTLYRDLLFGDDRKCHLPIPVKSFPIKENTGILFLNCNTSFHGATKIKSIQGTRRWIYYSISSRNVVWEAHEPNPFLNLFYKGLSVKQQLKGRINALGTGK